MSKPAIKVLVVGSKGMLGRYVKTYFTRQGYDVYELNRADLDISNFEEYEKLALYLKPVEVVINCAGAIKPVIKDPVTAFMINAIWPHYLARTCFNAGIKCYHVTTDCVFSGKDGYYKEESIPDMFDIYGFSKSIGDSCADYATVIRTSIIGEELENKRSLIEWAKSQAGQQVKGFTNHLWNGMTCLQLAKLIEAHYLEHDCEYGVHHIFSDTVNKCELLKLISDAFSLNLTVKPVKAPEAIDRTLSTIYKKEFQFSSMRIPALKEQIAELVGYYNEETN